MKKAYIIAGILIVLIITGAIIKSRPEPQKKPEAKTEDRFVAAEGKVEVVPGYEVEVGSLIEGRLESTKFKEGQNVEKGQLLAVIDNKDVQAKLKSVEALLEVEKSRLAEVQSSSRMEEVSRAGASLKASQTDLEFAENTLKRHEELYKKGYISKDVLEEKERLFKVSEARLKESQETKKLLERGAKKETVKLHEDSVKQAEAEVLYLKSILEKTYIKAPISGKAIRKYLNDGEMINKEMSLAAIADTKKIWINAEVDETDAGRISIGDEVVITSDTFTGEVFKGSVSEIADYVGVRNIKPNNQAKNLDIKVVQTKIKLVDANIRFKPGMTVDVKIKYGKNP